MRNNQAVDLRFMLPNSQTSKLPMMKSETITHYLQTDTILSLKKKIAEKIGKSIEEIEILRSNRVIENDQQLQDVMNKRSHEKSESVWFDLQFKSPCNPVETQAQQGAGGGAGAAADLGGEEMRTMVLKQGGQHPSGLFANPSVRTVWIQLLSNQGGVACCCECTLSDTGSTIKQKIAKKLNDIDLNGIALFVCGNPFKDDQNLAAAMLEAKVEFNNLKIGMIYRDAPKSCVIM